MMLRGRKIFITGGSRGIGAACVKACMDLGAEVGFTYLSRRQKAPEPEGHLEDDIVASRGYRADVRDQGSLREAMGSFSASGEKEGIDGIVVNAGIYRRSSFRDLTGEEWSKTISTNLDGAFLTARVGVELMDEGSMVFISSQLAFRGSEHGADYASSKAGVLGLSRSLAKELSPRIRVNSVAPGFVDTDILASDTKDKRRWREEQVPLGRIADPAEVAQVVVFLLSDMSSYMTGATIDVNGGLYVH